MGTSLHTSVNTDSIPSATSGSVPFQISWCLSHSSLAVLPSLKFTLEIPSCSIYWLHWTMIQVSVDCGATITGNGTVNMDNSFILDSMPNSNYNSSAPFQGKRGSGLSCATIILHNCGLAWKLYTHCGKDKYKYNNYENCWKYPGPLDWNLHERGKQKR